MKKFEYYTHPEAKKDECLLTNIQSGDWCHIGRKTKRAGSVAYDIHGKTCGRHPDFYPVFVKKEEMTQDGYTLVEIPYKK